MNGLLRAAFVVGRRDFVAILFSRAFLFFLLGPLFPIIVGVAAGGIGAEVKRSVDSPQLGLAMSEADNRAMLAARESLAAGMGPGVPDFITVAEGQDVDAARLLGSGQGRLGAVLGGTLDRPVLTGTAERLARWKAPVALMAGQARAGPAPPAPDIALQPIVSSSARVREANLATAQAGQLGLFLLTMLLAGMVLSNLVEEKGNKIIEILAAAVPMDAVFLGKLFAMLAVSLVGVAVWASAAGLVLAIGGSALPSLPPPAVGWPMFLLLAFLYFAMAYLLLGSLFLGIGSLAATVREVQTLSMPVTMLQLVVFLFASYTIGKLGEPVELAALAFPLSSPFAMLARAAQQGALWPHALALAWQGLWVLIIIRIAAGLFRRNVMKSGRRGPRKKRGRKGEPSAATTG